jgi:XTP/dITP diphosphohydrolase
VQVVLATANPGKQREFATMLGPRGFELLLQSELGIEAVEESGHSFEDNALLKARHAAAASGLPALADDSGLEVDALGGRPGVWSARFAGPGASDAQNNARLLAELALVPAEQRTARYRCVLALVRSADDVRPLIAQGSWEGRIGFEAAGSGGFGYDPYFIPAGLDCTAAQLSPARKNALSHRGAALRDLIARLGTWP